MRNDIENLSCPNCLGHAQLTKWKPKKGLDQNMRQFKCSCKLEFYVIVLPPKPEAQVMPGFAVTHSATV